MKLELTDKAQQLVDKWIEEEQRLRERALQLQTENLNWIPTVGRADQLSTCRRELQEMFGLVRKA